MSGKAPHSFNNRTAMNIENRLLPGRSHKLPPVVYVNELQPPQESQFSLETTKRDILKPLQ